MRGAGIILVKADNTHIKHIIYIYIMYIYICIYIYIYVHNIYIYIFRLKQKVGNHYYQLRDCSPAKDSKV